MQQVQVSQTYKEDTKSTETQANNSSSSSVSVKTRVRSFINEKRRMVGRGDEMEKLLDLLIEGQPFLSAISIWRGALTDDHIGSRVPTTTCFEDLIHHWSQTREMLAEFLARTVIRMSWSLLRDRFKISTRQLHQLWIAEGFIHENSEATAECYLVELVDRGFIQAMRTTSVGRQNQNVLYSWYFAADIHLKG
ncbi:hypothetical protein WN943_003307 [Citrus x changshan-huyou]